MGSSSVVSQTTGYNFGLSQGFLTGAQASLGLNNRNQSTSSNRTDFNPATTSDLDLQITQPLLQGFGLALNNRFIRIAKNNLKVSDLVFKQQVIATVASVINLYWDLVSFNEDVKVKQKALDLSMKLYSDNKKQVEIGTLAPIEIVRAEAEVAARQQDLTVSLTNVLQQETILKNVLSRTGVASPSVADAEPGNGSPSWGKRVSSSAPCARATSPTSPAGVTGQCCSTRIRMGARLPGAMRVATADAVARAIHESKPSGFQQKINVLRTPLTTVADLH